MGLVNYLLSGQIRVREVGPAIVLKHVWTTNVLRVGGACVKVLGI